MNFDQIVNFISNQNLVNFFVKAFAIVFSIIYILFSVVIFKQTQVMSKTVQTSSGSSIILISFIQIFIGIGLLIFALIIL